MIRLDTMLKMAVAWIDGTKVNVLLVVIESNMPAIGVIYPPPEVRSIFSNSWYDCSVSQCRVCREMVDFWDEKGESYNREWTKQRWNIVVNRTLKRVLSPHNICLSAANSKFMLRSNLIHQKSGLELVELNNIGWDQHVFRFFSSEQHTWRQFVFYSLKLYYNSSSW